MLGKNRSDSCGGSAGVVALGAKTRAHANATQRDRSGFGSARKRPQRCRDAVQNLIVPLSSDQGGSVAGDGADPPCFGFCGRINPEGSNHARRSINCVNRR